MDYAVLHPQKIELFIITAEILKFYEVRLNLKYKTNQHEIRDKE
jgi:hypothetical protein